MLKKCSIVLFLVFAIILIRKFYSLPTVHSNTEDSSEILNVYNVEQLKKLLDKNPTLVNRSDSNGNTALCNAALY